MTSHDNLIPSIGDVLMGRYRIESFVARGGMGVVMRARQLSMDREVAIKMILPQYAENEKTLARFDREVHLAKQLRHPNIVELYDYGSTEAGVLYLVMEYLEGEDLKTLLRRDGPMPIGRAGKITLQVLDALAEAHTQNIVHRDLKPSNIFVTQMRRLGDFAKLLDFGIAKSLAEDASEVTAQGEICGTSSYMAPEMFVQGSVATTVDVYAMALILLEMLLGKKVFRGQSSAETLVLHLRKDVVIPPPFAATNLSHVLTKALTKHPRHRYRNAVEFLEELEPALDSLDGSMRISPQTIARYSQDLSDDSGLLDQVLAGPWASGMTEPESGSSDIVVLPGGGNAEEPEEFEAAVTQLIERARDDFANQVGAQDTEPSEQDSSAPNAPDHSRPSVAKETIKMTPEELEPAEFQPENLKPDTLELDERDIEPLDEDELSVLAADTAPEHDALASTRKMEAEPNTGTMHPISQPKPWWRTRAAMVVFGLCCIAIFSVAAVIPLVRSELGSKTEEPSPVTPTEPPGAETEAEKDDLVVPPSDENIAAPGEAAESDRAPETQFGEADLAQKATEDESDSVTGSSDSVTGSSEKEKEEKEEEEQEEEEEEAEEAQKESAPATEPATDEKPRADEEADDRRDQKDKSPPPAIKVPKFN